jgi:hypothetical protein
LEERAIGAGTVTRDGLESMIRSTMETVINAANLVPTTILEEDHTAIPDSDLTMRMFNWGGKLNRLPRDYELPSGSVRVAFQQWMLNDTERNICRLRSCSPLDFDDPKKKKRFSDLKYLMESIETFCQDNDIWVSNPSLDQVNQMISAWESWMQLSRVSSKGRSRRLEQFKWTSIVVMLRNINKEP